MKRLSLRVGQLIIGMVVYFIPPLLQLQVKTITSLASGSHKLPFVSQTQSENYSTPFNDNSDHEESPSISDNMGPEHDEVDAHLNLVFYEADNYLSAEILSLLNHRYIAVLN